MKKNLALLLTLLAVLSSARLAHGQPHVIDLTYPDNVNLFDLYEVSFNLDSIYSNPYDPESISVSAEFVSTAHDTIASPSAPCTQSNGMIRRQDCFAALHLTVLFK